MEFLLKSVCMGDRGPNSTSAQQLRSIFRIQLSLCPGFLSSLTAPGIAAQFYLSAAAWIEINASETLSEVCLHGGSRPHFYTSAAASRLRTGKLPSLDWVESALILDSALTSLWIPFKSDCIWDRGPLLLECSSLDRISLAIPCHRQESHPRIQDRAQNRIEASFFSEVNL